MSSTKPFFFLFFVVQCIYAQNPIDSLKSVVAASKEDTTLVRAYLHFFKTDLFYENPSEVIGYTYKAKNLSEKIKYPIGIVDAHNNLGYIFRTKTQTDSAFYHYENAIKIAEKARYIKGLTDAYIGLGNVYNQLSQWNDAISQFNKVIEMSRVEGDSVQMGSAYNNIGNSYLSQSKYQLALENYQKSLKYGDPYIKEVAAINVAVVHNQMGNVDRAREYFNQSLKLAEDLNKTGHIAFIHKNLGVLEKNSGNFKEAIANYQEALKTYEGLSDDYNRSEIIQNMGNLYFEMKDYKKSLEYYDRSLAIQEKINYPSGVCYNWLFKSKAYMALGDKSLALQALDKAQECAADLKMLNIQMDVSQLLSEILEDQGKFSEALAAHRKFKILSDSINSVNNSEKIAELDTQYQATQKEQEIELLSAENEVANLQIQKQQGYRNILLITAILLMLLIAALYSRYSIKAKANDKLKELDNLKTNFFTNISHELRTPLTLIINPLERLLKKSENKETTDHLIIAKRNAERLLELTNELLDLSKLEAGKVNLEVAKVDLEQLFKVTSASFQSIADTKDIRFERIFNFDSTEHYLDADKIQKIVNNLLSNAFKFTPAGGEIRFTATSKKGRLFIEVQDTGVGLSEKEQHTIFDRFHQAGNHLESGGTGIGLTLTKELVQLHNGILHVKSKLGEGSTFSIEIPISKEAYSKNNFVESSKISVPKNLDGLITFSSDKIDIEKSSEANVVLIVEDNVELRDYIGSLFKDSYKVIFAKNGREGIETAVESLPDLIISDWMMPEMTGQNMCEALKNDEKTSHIPIILLTAKADKPSKLEGISIGADDYITKPFDNDELVAKVENMIQQRTNLKHKWSERIFLSPSEIEITNPDKSFIQKAILVVENHLSDSDFSVEHFQQEIGYSRMQLHRKLKALTDQSATEFIRNIRLQRAADMLSVNGQQVSDVAYQCGFNSLSYFTQCFKNKFGVNPSNYNQVDKH